MTKDNKVSKANQQRGKDRVGAASVHSKPKVIASVSKSGQPQSLSKPTESWDKTTERANITRRSRRLKITLPATPWDKE
jgi:hypothetical protein